jgi:hypothetical protein
VRDWDDFIVGCQPKDDAKQFLSDLRARFHRFHLALHPDKTRLIEFGRWAHEGVTVDAGGNIEGVSVNAAPGVSVQELTAPNPHTGYPGIPHNQVGVTTVGAIRAAGGDVIPAPTRTNPYHATVSGLTPEQASQLFRPTVKNPNTRTRVVE